MTTPDHELHTLAAPYAMDAVSDAERASFAAHLAGCEQCRLDVREMREATARLGLAAAVRPRPELRQQTIRAALAVPQLAPDLADEKPDKRRDSRPATGGRWRRAAGRLAEPRLPVRISLAAVAVLAAVAAVLGGVTSNTMSQLDHSRHQDHMIAAVLGAPDAVMLTAHVTTGGSATLVMSHRMEAAVLTARGLPALPNTESYEIWLMGPAGPKEAGMLHTGPGRMSGPSVVFGLRPGDVIGLTIEPAGGSSRPTTLLVVVFKPRQ